MRNEMSTTRRTEKWLANKSMEPSNLKVLRHLFWLCKPVYSAKPLSKKVQPVHFMATYFNVAYIIAPRKTRVRISIRPNWMTARFFTVLWHARASESQPNMNHNVCVVIESGIAVESFLSLILHMSNGRTCTFTFSSNLYFHADVFICTFPTFLENRYPFWHFYAPQDIFSAPCSNKIPWILICFPLMSRCHWILCGRISFSIAKTYPMYKNVWKSRSVQHFLMYVFTCICSLLNKIKNDI